MTRHPRHVCDIDNVKYDHDPIDNVRRCTVCGRSWIAYMPPKPVKGQEVALTRWKRVRWYSRWRP